MNFWDLLIALSSAGLCVVTIPILLSKQSKVPRWTSAVPIASLLTIMLPGFYMLGLYITFATITGQSIIWWLIAKKRGL